VTIGRANLEPFFLPFFREDRERLSWNGDEVSDHLFNEAFAMLKSMAGGLGTGMANAEISQQLVSIGYLG
jgi:hypothetical protein